MSRFVSGGTDKEPLTRDDAWLAAQRQPKPGVQADGKSLYETLQANKGDSLSKTDPLASHMLPD